MADQKLSLEELENNARQLPRALPPGIWALGLSAMFMDMSSELVHSLLPMFMASVLGASMLTIGFLEGVAEATAAITKIFSGALSDYLGKRKFLVVLGYGLAAVTKPVFPLVRPLLGSLAHGLSIGSAKAFEERLATP
jgi:MFS family permease